jgi:hypothetical protein
MIPRGLIAGRHLLRARVIRDDGEVGSTARESIAEELRYQKFTHA